MCISFIDQWRIKDFERQRADINTNVTIDISKAIKAQKMGVWNFGIESLEAEEAGLSDS